MADYQETVRARMKDLSSPSAATRRDAAYFLGEAGVDEAITKLATVYKSDPDPSVRKAAAYALGMFRAVDQALQHGEQDRVLKLLRRVVDEGKFGKRLRLRPATLARIEMVLGLVFVVLLALHFVLPNLGPLPGGITLPSLGVALESSSDASPNEDIATQTRTAYTSVRNDLTTLQSQFQSVLTGGEVNCTAFFNLPDPIDTGDATLPEAQAGLVEAVNAGQAVVMAGYQRLDSACYGDEPIEAAEVGALLAPVVTAQRALADLEPFLSSPAAPAIASEEPSPTPTVVPTDAPPTETPLPTEIPATATPALSTDPRDHVTALYGIIDSVSGPRNAVGLLRQVWTDTANAGTTRACSEPTPLIPADYVLPPEDGAALPELEQASEQVNLSLSLLRQGWNLFSGACASGTLLQQASVGLQTATTAEDALRVADGLLQSVRAGL